MRKPNDDGIIMGILLVAGTVLGLICLASVMYGGH